MCNFGQSVYSFRAPLEALIPALKDEVSLYCFESGIISIMDAGEKIPPVSKFEFSEILLFEKEKVTRVYGALVDELWKSWTGSIIFQVKHRSKAQELSLKADFSDGSYLHVLLGSFYSAGLRAVLAGVNFQEVLDSEQLKTELEIQAELDEGFAEEVARPNIHITEHAPDGRVLHRVVYGYSSVEKAVIRHDVNHTASITSELLSIIQLSEDINAAVAANPGALNKLANSHANTELAYEFKVNDQPISLEEFILVEKLLRTSNLHAFPSSS